MIILLLLIAIIGIQIFLSSRKNKHLGLIFLVVNSIVSLMLIVLGGMIVYGFSTDVDVSAAYSQVVRYSYTNWGTFFVGLLMIIIMFSMFPLILFLIHSGFSNQSSNSKNNSFK